MMIPRFLALLTALLFCLPCFADYDTTVTGTTGGSIWGSGPYTSDSVISSAAVHSGIITLGQTAIIRVRSEGNLSNYKGSTRNGVTTMDYSSSWAAISLSMVTSSQAPTVSLDAPVSVTAGSTFTVTVNATDANGDLNAHSLRYQGVGLVNWWTISGSSASHSETITAPTSPGIIYFRTECTDVAGNGTTGGWIPVQVVASSNSVPVVTLTVPASAPVNTTFSAVVTVTDANSNLASLALVKQNSSPPHQTLYSWPASGGSASQSGNVTAPSSATTLYLRGEATDTAPATGVSAWHAVAITSAPSATLSVTPSSVAPGGTISISYTGAPSTTTWIGLYALGAANTSYLQYVYVPNVGSGTVTLTLNQNFLAGSTYEARLLPDGGYTDIASSNSFQITGNTTPPSISSHPQSQTVSTGGSVTFSVAAAGAPTLVYQWRKDGSNISGATASSYTIGNVTSGHAGSYTVVVTNPYGSITSSAATLTVNSITPPTITSHPASQTVNAGSNVTFSVTATGTAPLSYQWRKNGVNLSGMVASSLTLTNVQSADAAGYSVVVTNAAASVASFTATLTVNTASPVITTQPQSQTVTAGANVTFSVSATGIPAPSYQWRKAGVNISGATQSSYMLTGVNSGHAGVYSVVVTNAYGSVTSSNATLTVTTVPVITTQPASQTVSVGANVALTVVASGAAPLSYQWKKDGGSISGATSSTLNLNNVQPAHAGSYTVVVTNSAGSATSSAAALVVNAPPAITTQPQNQTVNAGGTISFTVVASGSAPLSYQWRKNGSNISGATSATYTRSNAVAGDAGSYTVVVSNSAGSVTSSAATLTVNVVTIDLQINRPN